MPRPFRFSAHQDDVRPSTATSQSSRLRTLSTSSPKLPSRLNGYQQAGVDEWPSNLRSQPAASSSSHTSRPMTADSLASSPSLHHASLNSSRRNRASLLSVASDALSTRLSLRRKSTRQSRRPPSPQQNLLLPEVIHLSAVSKPDEEEEERSRLRDAAVQSVGIGPDMLDSLSMPPRDDYDYGDEPENGDGESVSRPSDSFSLLSESGMHSVPTTVDVPLPHPPRHRAGSLALSTTHSRTASSTPSPSLPPFPAKHSALAPFVQLSGTLPKHYPPPSLLLMALSKQWKSRFIALTSPHISNTRRRDSVNPSPSYLHLFRSPGPDERELERLEINERSVIFVTDEEISSRRSIVKVGGIDVGAMRKDWNIEDNGLTMMLLQIVDVDESRSWIGAIKSAVLGQRSIRAGLGHAYSHNGAEPRGDMDVVLSIRMQGLLPPSPPTQAPVQAAQRSVSDSVRPTSLPPAKTTSSHIIGDNMSGSPFSARSARSRMRPTSTRPGGTVLSFKGLFTGARPRSPSRTSSDTSTPDADEDTAPTVDSFGSVGSSLLGLQGPVLVKPGSVLPTITDAPLSRQIVPNRKSIDSAAGEPGVPHIVHELAHSIAAIPPARPISPSALHPPPLRLRAWTTSSEQGTPGRAAISDSRIYSHGNTSNAGSFGVEPGLHFTPTYEEAPVLTPVSVSNGTNTPTGKPRPTSVSSFSTMGSENMHQLAETGSLSKRRWSRQSSLQHRLTPPAGTPPPTPSSNMHSPQRTSLQLSHPYSADQSSTNRSSISSNSHRTLPGLSSLKRASVSSAASVYSTETSPSQTNGSLFSPASRKSTVRMSMPPPQRPAPSSALPPTPDQRGSSRPRSLSARAGSSTNGSASGSPLSSTKPSLRDRALRLSLLPPTSPPTEALPPRPDEPVSAKGHRRGSSIDTPYQSIPAMTLPPTRPLPPPPGSDSPSHTQDPSTSSSTSSTANSSSSVSSPKLATAIKQRLRLRSTPSSSPAPSPILAQFQPNGQETGLPSPGLADRITDPSFLVLTTPTTAEPAETELPYSSDLLAGPVPPAVPPRSPLRPPPPERDAGVTPLAPPPSTRRRVAGNSISSFDKLGGGGDPHVRQGPLRLPEEASRDMGRGGLASASRLSLGVVDA